MKTFKTPTIKATVNYDPALLKSNHIYLAATDNEKIYVDDLFQQMPLYVRTYLLLHEEGILLLDILISVICHRNWRQIHML